jgi:aspartyl-tRNA synthetase
MAETMKGLKRTSLCTAITVEDIGKEVVLAGWCHKQRDLGGITFIALRDISGEIQLVADEHSPKEVLLRAGKVRSEYVLAVRGILTKRSSPNPSQKTGQVEVHLEELRILSESKTPPFYIEKNSDTNEALRLQYRYLDLRRPDMQNNLIVRHQITKYARDYYDSQGFLEIETPILTKSTPEGARDYLVPSRIHPGKFFALPQSPQLFKQLLMLSGYDRYMQIARCFRDEDLRADRQPEFTQIDLEMSFVDMEDVIKVNEDFLCGLFEKILGVNIPLPMKRIEYREAMNRFGSDKPDLRFGLELKEVSDIAQQINFPPFVRTKQPGYSVRLINIPGKADLSRREIDSFGEYVKGYGATGIAYLTCGNEPRGSVLKYLTEEQKLAIYSRAQASSGDMIFMIADRDEVVYHSLGALRCEIARRYDMIPTEKYEFVWITHFPLFEYDTEESRYVAKHHPFTSPMDEDMELLDKDPGKVRAKAYDIVLNGCELGGGSIRICDPSLQKRVFSLIGLSEKEAYNRFGFLLNAFAYGVPPHGGLAFGLDRIVMLMTGNDSIRDVIAFPKVQNSSCLMTEAPDFVESKQLEELHIAVIESDEMKE